MHLCSLGTSFTVSVFYFENIHAKKNPESLEQHFFLSFFNSYKINIALFFLKSCKSYLSFYD